jgi:hypothetical protein
MEEASKIFYSKRIDFYIFFNFPGKNLTAKFVVIGFKRGNSPAMGGKKAAVRLEFGKSREAGESAHLAYVKHPYIAQGERHENTL